MKEYIIKIGDKPDIMGSYPIEEQKELVRCRDCKYAHLTYDGECKYCDMDKDEYGNIEAKYKPGD